MDHLSDEDVERFLTGRLSPESRQRVVRHLLTACSHCQQRLIGLAPDGLLQSARDRHRPSLRDRTLAAALQREARAKENQEKLARSLKLLKIRAQGDDGISLRWAQTLQGVPLVEALLQQSFELRYRDPAAMRWLAYNALTVAKSLRQEEHGQFFVCDLQARVWGNLANAYKVNDEFDEADGAIENARTLLRQGSGDLQLLAFLADKEASLRFYQRRLTEAQELLDRAYQLYLQLGDQHLAGQSLISRGNALHLSGNYRQSLQETQNGLSLIEPDRDPKLALAGKQCLAYTLLDRGEPLKASELFLKNGIRQAFANDPLVLIRIRTFEGRLFADLGRISRAAQILREVRSDSKDLGREYYAAVTGLLLLPLLLKQGKNRELRQTANEVHGTLSDLGIHSDAAKAQPYLE